MNEINISKKNILNFLKYLLYAFYAINVIFIIYIIWAKFNFLRIDITWHIASWSLFWKWYFHQFFDWAFGWYISNLFYPPWEDLLISIFSGFGLIDYIIGFKIYLTVISIWFAWSILYLSSIFRNISSKIIFLTLMFIVLNIEKTGLTYFQWMGWMDMLTTWLTSQILWWIFFFVLLKKIFDWKKTPLITILLALTLCSHMVVWPVAFFTVLIIALYKRDKSLIKQLFIVILLTSFFWLPLIVFKWYMVSDTIFFSWEILDSFLWILLTITTIISFIKSEKNIFWLFGIIALFIILPSYSAVIILSQLPHIDIINTKIFPSYHYYRLHIFSLIYLVLMISGLWEYSRKKTKFLYLVKRILLILMILMITKQFSIYNYIFWPEKYYQQYWKTEIEEDQIDILSKWIQNNWLERTLIIQTKRWIDFYLSSLLTIKNPNINTVKWLFWESSKSNIILSSYINSILSENDIPIKSFRHIIKSEDQFKYVFKNWLRDYNVKHILFKWHAKYLPEKNSKIIYDFLKKWDDEVSFTNKGNINFDQSANAWYTRFEANFIKPNNAIEYITTNKIKNMDLNDDDNYWIYMENMVYSYLSWKQFDTIYLDINSSGALIKNSEKSNIFPLPNITKTGKNTYNINIPTQEDVRFKIKLNYMPGLHLYDNEWNEYELYRWINYLIAKWHWEMKLVYKKPFVMRLGYGISMLSLVWFLYYIYYQKKYGKKVS